jgi:hypothetical protein
MGCVVGRYSIAGGRDLRCSGKILDRLEGRLMNNSLCPQCNTIARTPGLCGFRCDRLARLARLEKAKKGGRNGRKVRGVAA